MKSTLRLLAAILCVTAAATTVAAGEKLFYDNRDEIPIEYRWDRSDIVPSTEVFDAKYAEVEAGLPRLTAYAGRLSESPEVLAEALELKNTINREVEDIYVWASQWQHEDTRAADANAYLGRARALLAAFNEAEAFFKSEIASMSDEQLAAYRSDAALESYDHYIDNIVRTKQHIRSSEVEEVLAAATMLRDAPQQNYTSLAMADVEWPVIVGEDGEQVTATSSLFYTFMNSQDRRVRRDAALTIFGTYAEFGNTFAGLLGANIQRDLWLARTRGYSSTLEMALDEIKVPQSVVDTLVAAVHDNLDVVHRYVTLRKRLLELDEVHIYDMYVGVVPDSDLRYTFDEGWQLAMEFWRETLGDEYAAVASRALAERWVDVYPSAGKRGGAYSWGTYDSHPYLLLNWGGTLDDVFTLVHEMGHSIHSYLASSNQPYHDASYSLFVAEVASVAPTSLFYEWLIGRTDDPKVRLALVNYRVNSILGTFLRQIFFHEFEAAAHAMADRGEAITKDSLSRVWGELWQSYYGPDAALDDSYTAGWARIPHFYRTFYVWVYATSFAAGEAIAGRFREGDASAVDDYLETLKLGGSVYPMEALQRAGVDMNDPAVIRTVMDQFRDAVAEMEELVELTSSGG